MAIYKKRVSLGNFLKKGEDFKENDILEILDEGKQEEGKFGTQDIFMLKTSDEKEGNVNLNTTSINNLIDAYGEDSKNWIGKKIKVWTLRSNIQGRMILVYYFSHPDAVLNDEGVFELNGKKDGDIPVINEPAPKEPGEEIPF